ncbi:biogenesis of lysosome-related organelles complex 1 subunit 6-like [Colias croceus]|uniref:biogenesis of lysosome-related organelles complex 1 subunit 6-like n=1 Tax=Colias crocea TaxID=72248 RepID=UPI001E27CF35|nr:biogenesis of lysosome-related organelles complex 1 subunit 6-like [Colias croceus]
MSSTDSAVETTVNPENVEDLKTVQLLAKGMLELYEPPLVTIKTHLKELTEKQDAVHNMLLSERRRLEDLQNDATLDALLADVATSKEKLNSISNSMISLHKRVQALQTRAVNVEKIAKSRAANNSQPKSGS